MSYDAESVRGQRIQGQDGKIHILQRKIDSKFATTIEGHIIKMSNGEILPADEPTILFRARDRLAIELLEHYNVLSERDGCNDYHFGLVDSSISDFQTFKKENPTKMKQPSITRGK